MPDRTKPFEEMSDHEKCDFLYDTCRTLGEQLLSQINQVQILAVRLARLEGK